MKKFAVLIALLFAFGLTSFAQQRQQAPTSAIQAPTSAIYESAEELMARYNFDEAQTKRLTKILQNRRDNLTELEPLRAKDEARYWQKRKAAFVGEQASIGLILTTEAQQKAHAEVRYAMRRLESETIKGLLAAGYNKADARLLMLKEIY